MSRQVTNDDVWWAHRDFFSNEQIQSMRFVGEVNGQATNQNNQETKTRTRIVMLAINWLGHPQFEQKEAKYKELREPVNFLMLSPLWEDCTSAIPGF